MTLGLVLVVIMVVMLCVKMPEGRDAGDQDSLKATFKRLFANRKYIFGVVAQFFYVGAQIGTWSFTIRLAMHELGIVEAKAATIYLLSIIGFSVSRFVYTWLMKFIKPTVLLIASAILSALCAAMVVITAGSGMTAIVFLMLISVFMSLMFPTIYGVALDRRLRPDHGHPRRSPPDAPPGHGFRRRRHQPFLPHPDGLLHRGVAFRHLFQQNPIDQITI